MARQKKRFRFRGVLDPVKAVFMKTGIFIPPEVVRALPPGRVRVEGTCNGAPFALAVLHLKDGRRYFSVSAALRRAAKIEEGDPVEVAFTLVDPEVLRVPEELEAVIAQDEAAREAWEKLTRGYQRSLVHYITSVKSTDSRIRRSIELMEKAKAGRLHGPKRQKPD